MHEQSAKPASARHVGDQIEVAIVDLYRDPHDISRLAPDHERLLRYVESSSADDFIAALTMHILEGPLHRARRR